MSEEGWKVERHGPVGGSPVGNSPLGGSLGVVGWG